MDPMGLNTKDMYARQGDCHVSLHQASDKKLIKTLDGINNATVCKLLAKLCVFVYKLKSCVHFGLSVHKIVWERV